jgi:flagellar basal-body rod modification protein FlgD
MITATDTTSALSTSTGDPYENPDGILDKDDFMQLLLIELQNQDPTEPTDTATILTQTSQLATLEASENTNIALSELAEVLAQGDQFSAIAAIGKTADLGSNGIVYDEGEVSSFEVYFPEEISSGVIEILDSDGVIVSTLEIEPNSAGVYQFDWDGTLSSGSEADAGIYYVTSSYNNPDGDALTTRMGSYPIESVRFEDGSTLVKVGSSYVPIENIVEIY